MGTLAERMKNLTGIYLGSIMLSEIHPRLAGNIVCLPCLDKNLYASKPYKYQYNRASTQSGGGNVKTFRWERRL